MLRLVVEMNDERRPIAASCHGPCMLCSARLPDGRPVVNGCLYFFAVVKTAVKTFHSVAYGIP